ncbi:MAG: hypothetical protein OEY77_05000 [Nitrospira sp.]|nr:hypothetical protein [Nitrospira sp.]
MEVRCVPLVQNVDPPRVAPATTRTIIPKGYGTQEQCLPFTAANSLGFLIESPITFGFCPVNEIPDGAHSFLSPVVSEAVEVSGIDLMKFYVKDDYGCNFVKNAFYQLSDTHEAMQALPGLSFFDREDQQDMFKVHLPYILRTSQNIDTLFLPAINRGHPGFTVQAGLVETDWYANSINLVLRHLPSKPSFHVVRGDPIAQVVFIDRDHRSPSLTVLPEHARETRTLLREHHKFIEELSRNRSIYKKLARGKNGFVS